MVKTVKEMKWTEVKILRDEEWKEVDGMMYKERKVYVSKDNILRVKIIRLHHDTPVGGHGGQWKTVELVARNNKRGEKICRRVWFLPKEQKPHRAAGWQINA